jgi:hypothetical protein
MFRKLLGFALSLFVSSQAFATEYWMVGGADAADTNTSVDVWVIIGKPGGTVVIDSDDTCRYNTPSDNMSGNKANFYVDDNTDNLSDYTFYEVTGLTVDSSNAKGARIPMKLYKRDARPDPGKKANSISLESNTCLIDGAEFKRSTSGDLQ